MVVSGFRNLPHAVVDLDAPLIALVGENGQGKTNWLEAAGIVGTLRSFRSPRPAELITWGQSSCSVDAVVQSDGMVRKLTWAYTNGTRTLKRDDRAVDSLSWLSSFRASYFIPGDVAPIRGEPALRRALLDRAILAVDPRYLSLARDYRRVIDHKTALLKNPRSSEAELDVLDAQLVSLGAAVTSVRAQAIHDLSPIYSDFYETFASGEGSNIAYEPWLGEGDRTTLEERFSASLLKLRPRERAIGRPLGGPHRDDVTFTVRGHPARAYASQGQARSAVLAWKLAEIAVARLAGEAPVFLLDDLGSELDPARTARLLASLASLNVQTILSTTDQRFVPRGAMGGEVRVFHVRGGALESDAGAGDAG